MNKAIEIFGKHIYKSAQRNPARTRRELALVYRASGLQCKYFPSKALLPARQYMQWAASDAVVKPLGQPQQSAIVSLYLPCEILHAMGIHQMFPEALACYLAAAGSERIFIDTAENHGVPKTFCSYHKVFIGLVETGVLPKPQFIINTSLACDANRLSFRRAAEYFNIPQFMIDVPGEYNNRNLNYVAEQLADMVGFIEQYSGAALDQDRLADSIARSKNTLANFRKIMALRAECSLSDEMTSQMFSLFSTYVMLGTKEAEKYSEDLLAQLEKQPRGTRGVRLLWVHTLPYWQDALRNLINFTDRCEIVACDMTLDAIDVNLEESDPYRYMAERLLKNTANGSCQNRIHAVLKYARELHADGIVWYCHWGCKQTAGAAATAKAFLEKNGLPTLILDGDGCDSQNVNDGQTVTRMEAFLELLENKK